MFNFVLGDFKISLIIIEISTRMNMHSQILQFYSSLKFWRALHYKYLVRFTSRIVSHHHAIYTGL